MPRSEPEGATQLLPLVPVKSYIERGMGENHGVKETVVKSFQKLIKIFLCNDTYANKRKDIIKK